MPLENCHTDFLLHLTIGLQSASILFWHKKYTMNDDKPANIRTALNEIDAKEYLLSVAEKYKIPIEETELTKQQLEYYRYWLTEMGENDESH